MNFLRQAKTNEVINEETDNEFEELPRTNRPTYWLTRFMILRLLGVVYAIAFLVAINQIIPLIGSDGLTPVGIYLKNDKRMHLVQMVPVLCDCHRSFGSGILIQLC